MSIRLQGLGEGFRPGHSAGIVGQRWQLDPTSLTTPEDFLAVQRAYDTSGRDAAMVEVRRRWPMIAETVIGRTLDKILGPVDKGR